MSIKFDLLINQSADSALTVIHPGGKYCWFAQATAWNGGELKLQIQMPDGATLADYVGAVQTANGMMVLDLPAGATVKAVRGAPNPTGISSSLVSF